jgi:nucleotide-binding universal stress UspA family protein
VADIKCGYTAMINKRCVRTRKSSKGSILAMYNRILVAVDGSDTSKLALKEAIKLAKDQHSVLRLVHVVDPTEIYFVVEGSYAIDYQKALEAAGQEVIAQCSVIAAQAGMAIEAASIGIEKRGQHIYDVIEDEAERWRADLIIIGTHGRRGIRRLFLGSVAEGLTRIASKPVLLIRGA